MFVKHRQGRQSDHWEPYGTIMREVERCLSRQHLTVVFVKV